TKLDHDPTRHTSENFLLNQMLDLFTLKTMSDQRLRIIWKDGINFFSEDRLQCPPHLSFIAHRA
ncbi:MAG: hypothetical protein WBW71_10735, partial [Bacteroidota bacterium]